MQTIVVIFFLALGMFAQETKPATSATETLYRCSLGAPMWLKMDEPADVKVREAAWTDCEGRYKKEQADESAAMREFSNQLRRFEEESRQRNARMEILMKRVCQRRVRFADDGTDQPECKGIPPRLDILQNAHKVCQQIPDLKMCGHLIPLSMAKATPVIEVRHKPGEFFTEYSGARVILAGNEGKWEDEFIGKEDQLAEFLGFNPKNSHTLTVIPNNDTNQTFQYVLPVGTSHKLEFRRTFCNAAPAGYSIYFTESEAKPPIRPQGFPAKKDCQ